MKPTIQSYGIDKLTVDERLDLIDQIWDSLPESSEPTAIPDWHIPILEERLAEAEATPAFLSPGEKYWGSLRRPMSVPLILRPKAEEDIRNLQIEFEAIRAGLGNRFLTRVRETLERIEFMPKMYGVVWRRVRAAPIKKFRHVIYYVSNASSTEVIAVVHGARRRSSWQSRL